MNPPTFPGRTNRGDGWRRTVQDQTRPTAGAFSSFQKKSISANCSRTLPRLPVLAPAPYNTGREAAPPGSQICGVVTWWAVERSVLSGSKLGLPPPRLLTPKSGNPAARLPYQCCTALSLGARVSLAHPTSNEEAASDALTIGCWVLDVLPSRPPTSPPLPAWSAAGAGRRRRRCRGLFRGGWWREFGLLRGWP